MSKILLKEEHYRQIQDRINVFCGILAEHLLQHPVCKLDKGITKMVEDAVDSLYNAQLEIKKKLENGQTPESEPRY